MKLNPKHSFIPIALAIGILIIIYYLFDPNMHIFPQCIFYRITGWQCAGCGSQRMIHALLHGDIAAAWNYNAALLVASPIFITMIIASLFRNKLPRLYDVINSKTVIYCLLTGILAWWILRNVFDV